MRVMGLDLSITSTGMCVLGNKGVYFLGSIPTKPNDKDFLWDDYKRFDTIASTIMSVISKHKIKRLFIEAPAFAAHDMGGRQAQLRGIVMFRLWEAYSRDDFVYVSIAPTKLKKFIVGSGKNGSKNLMGEAVRRSYPIELQNVRFTNDDEIDAYALAKFGHVSIQACKKGFKFLRTIPKYQREALKGCY